MEELFDFLGVAQVPLQNIYKKVTHDDLSKAVTNFEEVVDRYKDTRFEPMFREVLFPA